MLTQATTRTNLENFTPSATDGEGRILHDSHYRKCLEQASPQTESREGLPRAGRKDGQGGTARQIQGLTGR